MCADNFSSEPSLPSDDDLDVLVPAFLERAPGAAERMTAALTKRAALTALNFLGSDVGEVDDIVQDSVVSTLEWLARQEEFSGSLVTFTITVTRNRCRNYLTWRRLQRVVPLSGATRHLAEKSLSPLEALLASERATLLQAAVDDLEPACRALLHGLYFQERHMNDLLAESDLISIQGLYRRRAWCLAKVKKYLKNRLDDCSSLGELL